jgi:hypothetical protein
MKDKAISVKFKKGNQLAKIRGILIPVGWDEKGSVVAVGLSGTDEKQYFIEKNEKQKKLLGFIQKEVELSGRLKEQAGNWTILVKRWSRICRGTVPK